MLKLWGIPQGATEWTPEGAPSRFREARADPERHYFHSPCQGVAGASGRVELRPMERSCQRRRQAAHGANREEPLETLVEAGSHRNAVL
jgi:hypothetical protein